ncbi:LOW QUALITY PROTEIN: ComA domain-containing protein, partial [Cephalotus follicularis]
MASYYGWKSFDEDEDRPEKPRRYGVTEMRGPHYNVLSQNVLQDIFECMGQFVDGLKFSGGSDSLMPKSYIKQVIDMAHQHHVYVSTGDWAEHLLRKGPSSFKDYVEECKQLGFDTIELNAGSLDIPEETLLRYVRLIKSGGLKVKPQFTAKFNKSDIPVGRDRAYGAYVVPVPRSLELVEDVDFLIRRAERCLEAGADMIMIDADGVSKYTDSVRADIIAKVIGRLGLEKIMFEASNARTSEWFVKQYGPKRGSKILKKKKKRQNACVWFALKKSLDCKSEETYVYDPKKTNSKLSTNQTTKQSRIGCPTSITNPKDVIRGIERHTELPCSPRPMGSSDSLSAITTDTKCEHNKIISSGCHECCCAFFGTLKPGTRGRKPRSSNIPLGKIHGDSHAGGIQSRGEDSTDLVSLENLDSVEEHQLSKHAGNSGYDVALFTSLYLQNLYVTELVEGDCSWNIVKKICRTNCSTSENNYILIERVLKVHNTRKAVAQFEECRELVKIEANKLAGEHPRCLADGNELLRFYCTTMACSLGINQSSTLCPLDNCGVCGILRHGFSTSKTTNNSKFGIFTSATSERALESLQLTEGNQSLNKALIICRVIAGRVHEPLGNIQELAGRSGFDSVSVKVGSDIEELYLLNYRALLPCFVVICK